jgi:hypothetical protein
MINRPNIDSKLSGGVFRSFYYLKEELVNFCKDNGLPTSGGKIEITDRIAHYLDTGEVLPVSATRRAKSAITEIIKEESEIERGFVCSEKHRTFFKERIGQSFSFNVTFQKWLKENAGKTYSQAIGAYHQILKEKKKSKTTIDKQFEYNTYIRDFFEDNRGSQLEAAIKCWKYKKALQGHNRYEKADLIVLEEH